MCSKVEQPQQASAPQPAMDKTCVKECSSPFLKANYKKTSCSLGNQGNQKQKRLNAVFPRYDTSLTLNISSLARQRCIPSWGPRRTPCFFFVISQLFDAVDYSNYVFWVSETIIQ